MEAGKVIYHKGKAVKKLSGGTWLFEVEGKLYTNLLKTCLDYSCDKIYPGFEFEISDMALEVSDFVGNA